MKKAFLILTAMLIASVTVNVYLMVRGPKIETTIETKTDTVWRDTMIEKPVPAETIDIGKTVYIKVPVPKYLPGDTVHDSIGVPVPIVQKRYDDSLYTAWVSGFEPNLDSILIHQREVTNTITITNTVVKPASRFAIGPSVGLGYGIKNKQTDMFVGINATYNLFKK